MNNNEKIQLNGYIDVFYKIVQSNRNIINIDVYVEKSDVLVLPSIIDEKIVNVVNIRPLNNVPPIINKLVVPDGLAISVDELYGSFIKHIVFEGELRFNTFLCNKPIFYGLESLEYKTCLYDIIDGVFYSKPNNKMRRSLVYYPFFKTDSIYVMPDDVNDCFSPICNKWVEHIVISKNVTNSGALIQSCDSLKSLFIFKSFDRYNDGGAYSRIGYELSEYAGSLDIESKHPNLIEIFNEGNKDKLVWWRWINTVTPSSMDIKLKWKHNSKLEDYLSGIKPPVSKMIINDPLLNSKSEESNNLEELEFEDLFVKCLVAHDNSKFGYGSLTSCSPSFYYHNCDCFGDFLDNIRTINKGDCIKKMPPEEYKKYNLLRLQLYSKYGFKDSPKKPSIILHQCSPWPNYEINYISCELYEIQKGGFLDYLALLKYKKIGSDCSIDLFFTDAFSSNPTGVVVKLVGFEDIQEFDIQEFDPKKRSYFIK